MKQKEKNTEKGKSKRCNKKEGRVKTVEKGKKVIQKVKGKNSERKRKEKKQKGKKIKENILNIVWKIGRKERK